MTLAAFPDIIPNVGPTGSGLRHLVCAAHLVDRRTGQTHRVNGRPVALLTCDPEAAAATLLLGRDATVWDVRIEQIAAEVRP